MKRGTRRIYAEFWFLAALLLCAAVEAGLGLWR